MNNEINITLSLREFHTILAALRLWQETDTQQKLGWITLPRTMVTVRALDDNEIEELCERINAYE